MERKILPDLRPGHRQKDGWRTGFVTEFVKEIPFAAFGGIMRRWW